LFRRRSHQAAISTDSSLQEEEDGFGEAISLRSELDGSESAVDTIRSSTTPLSSPSLQMILPEVLTPKEFEARLREGIRIPSSLVKGRTYVLQMGRRIKVLDKGRGRNKITYLCVGSRQCADDIDEYTALYLNLVLNEKGLIRSANVMNTDYQGLVVQTRNRRTAAFLNPWQ
jgi:hypothetical protein